ncbi:MAG: SRPBCC family protein [Bacteriovorax sp.]
MSLLPVKNISVSIHTPAFEVYDFVIDPQNLPQWASGLGGAVQQINGEWMADSPLGAIKIRFAPRNGLGVLDHIVTLPSGEEVVNPMRVVANDFGSLVIFTLFQRPEMTEEQFDEDAEWVRKDLERLKSLMEKH